MSRHGCSTSPPNSVCGEAWEPPPWCWRWCSMDAVNHDRNGQRLSRRLSGLRFWCCHGWRAGGGWIGADDGGGVGAPAPPLPEPPSIGASGGFVASIVFRRGTLLTDGVAGTG